MTVTELRIHAAHLRAAAEAMEADAARQEAADKAATEQPTSPWPIAPPGVCRCLIAGGSANIPAMTSGGVCPACHLPRLVLHQRPAVTVEAERIDVCDD